MVHLTRLECTTVDGPLDGVHGSVVKPSVQRGLDGKPVELYAAMAEIPSMPRSNDRGAPERPDARKHGNAALARHESPQQAKLELLEKQHARLLKDVTSKRRSLEALKALTRDVMDDLARRVLPLQQEALQNLQQVRRMFERLLADKSRLAGRERRMMREIYEQFLESLPWELRIRTEAPDADDESDPFEFGRKPSDDPFGTGEQFDDDEPNTQHGDEVASATQPEARQTQSLRELFKRLVTRLHPDKVTDDAQKAERTTAMKEVTRAYQSGDLARLLELEADLAAVQSESSSDEITIRAARLERQNRELRKQLRQLTSDRKELRDALPFHVDLRSPKRLHEQVEAQVAQLAAEVEAEALQSRSFRDYIQRFADGKLSFDEFCAGPPEARATDLEDALETLLDELWDEPAPRSRRTRAKKSGRTPGGSRR